MIQTNALPFLKIVEFNVENLFLGMDFFEREDISQLTEKEWKDLTLFSYHSKVKSLEKLTQLGQTIQKINPHIMILCEVGGELSLSSFNKHFLDDQYGVCLIEGNSSRGIDLGYLVRKDLPFRYKLISHREKRLSSRKEKFSRDVLELRIFHQDKKRNSKLDPKQNMKRPILILLAVHFKSKIDKEGLDPQGRARRTLEVNAAIEIYRDLEKEFSGKVPIILGGDFNGHAALPHPHPEFSAIYDHTVLKDALEVAQKPLEERITHLHFHTFGLLEKTQLDYLFLSPLLHPFVDPQETLVHPFEGAIPIPQTREEKFKLPSDHFPVVLTLKTEIADPFNPKKKKFLFPKP